LNFFQQLIFFHSIGNIRNNYFRSKFKTCSIQRFAALINAGVNQPIHPNSGKHFERDSTVTMLSKLAIFVDESFDCNPASNSFVATLYSKSSAAGAALNIPVNDRRKQNFTKLFKKLSIPIHFESVKLTSFFLSISWFFVG
jgi:hypothetical protein